MPKVLFTICTIANDLTQYGQMRESFVAAGFDEGRCEYRLFDNSAENFHDPYDVLSTAAVTSNAHYVIVCHQDIRIDRGAGFSELVQRLRELTTLDPSWAVAGNFGITPTLTATGKVFDPNGTSHPGPFPREVVSLDENFLVMPTNMSFTCTPGLRGFHLYGTDICLNAIHAGRSCYVINFDLTHLSGGNTNQDAFRVAVAELTAAWNSRFVLAVIGTPNVTLQISRWKPIRTILGSTKVCRALNWLGVNFIAYPGWHRTLRRRPSHGVATAN